MRNSFYKWTSDLINIVFK